MSLVHPVDIYNLERLMTGTHLLFLYCERFSKARNWSDADCALMLQCVFIGKLREAYSFLSTDDTI